MTKEFKIHISEKLGEVSAIAQLPEGSDKLLVLAHGAGAGMTHSFMVDLANQLFAAGIGTLRYNLVYMENGKKRPDVPAVAHKAIEMVAEFANSKFPDHQLFLSGKSFGGRMSSQRTAKESPDFVKGLIFFGFPLHAIGKPSKDRAEHLYEIKDPMLFLQGSKDKLATIELIEEVVSDLPTAEMIVLEDADHSFKRKKEVLIPELVEAVAKWLK